MFLRTTYKHMHTSKKSYNCDATSQNKTGPPFFRKSPRYLFQSHTNTPLNQTTADHTINITIIAVGYSARRSACLWIVIIGARNTGPYSYRLEFVPMICLLSGYVTAFIDILRGEYLISTRGSKLSILYHLFYNTASLTVRLRVGHALALKLTGKSTTNQTDQSTTNETDQSTNYQTDHSTNRSTDRPSLL